MYVRCHLLGVEGLENRAGPQSHRHGYRWRRYHQHQGFHAAVEAAQVADAVIYPIVVMPITNEAGRNVGGENALTTWRSGPAAAFSPPPSARALDQRVHRHHQGAAHTIPAGLLSQRCAADKDRFHRLEVEVRRPDLRVTARNGYYGIPRASPDVGRPRPESVTPEQKQQEKE